MKIKDWDLNLKIRLYGEAAYNILFWMFFPFMAIYFSEVFGPQYAGLLLILSQVFSVIANLLGGYYADYYGRKKMMVFASVGQGASFLLFALANSPWFEWPVVTFVAFSVLGVFGAFYWPASQAMIADVVEEKDQSSVFAVFYTGINIAVVIGPILGAIFFFKHRFPLLLVAALVSFLLAILIQVYIRETAPPQVTKKASGSLAVIKHQLKEYKMILNDKTFLLYLVAGILVAQTFMQLDLLLAVYTKDVVDHQDLFSLGTFTLTVTGETAFGYIVSENGLMVALLTVVVTKWVEKYEEKHIFMISSMVYAIGIFLFGQTTNLWLLFVAMAIFTIAEIMGVGIQQSFIAKLAPEDMRGQYYAAASLRYTVGKTIAPVMIPLSTLIGYQWTFILLALLALLSAAIYAMMFRIHEGSKKQLPI